MRRATAAVCGALLLATACSTDGDDPTPKKTTAAPEKGSIFDSGINIAAKFDQPGFNYKDRRTQKYAGFENDLSLFLSEHLEFPDMKLHDEPSHRREKALTGGTSQLVIATYSITTEREKEVDFAGPYFETPQGLLVRRNDSSITSREEAQGKAVCTARGSTSAPGEKDEQEIKKLLPGIHLVPVDNYSLCVSRLKKKEVDAVWTDLALLHGFTERFDDVKVVKNLELGAPQRYGVGIAEGQEADCRKIAAALKKFVGSPRWVESFRIHFPKLAAREKEFEQRYKPSVEDIESYSCQDD